MASVTSVLATPSTIMPAGGQSTITYTLSNPPTTVVVTLTDETGATGSATLTLSAENVTLGVDPTLIVGGKAPRGMIVATASPGGLGTLAAVGNSAFTFTAA